MKSISFLRNTAGLLVGLMLVASCSKENLPTQPNETLSFKSGNLVPISILASGLSSNGINSGTYAANGAFSSAGSWTETYSWNGSKYHSKIDFADANGSFEMHVSGNLAFSSATDGNGTGTWTIKKCTGVYAGMDGNGSNTIVISNWNPTTGGNVSETFDGGVDL